MNKITLTEEVKEQVTLLAKVADMAPVLVKAWWDNEYTSSGSDPISDSDIIDVTGLTATKLESAMVLLEAYDKLCSNQEVTKGDYKSTMNKIRSSFS